MMQEFEFIDDRLNLPYNSSFAIKSAWTRTRKAGRQLRGTRRAKA